MKFCVSRPTIKMNASVSTAPRPGRWKPNRRSGCHDSGSSKQRLVHGADHEPQHPQVMASGTSTSRPVRNTDFNVVFFVVIYTAGRPPRARGPVWQVCRPGGRSSSCVRSAARAIGSRRRRSPLRVTRCRTMVACPARASRHSTWMHPSMRSRYRTSRRNQWRRLRISRRRRCAVAVRSCRPSRRWRRASAQRLAAAIAAAEIRDIPAGALQLETGGSHLLGEMCLSRTRDIG